MKDANGFTMYDYGDGKGLTDYAGNRTFMSGSNPASSGQLDKNKYTADVFGGRWGAEFDIYDGLSFNYNLGLDIDHTNRTTLYNAFYGQYAGMGGSIYKYAYTTKAINHQFLLNYSHDFGKTASRRCWVMSATTLRPLSSMATRTSSISRMSWSWTMH